MITEEKEVRSSLSLSFVPVVPVVSVVSFRCFGVPLIFAENKNQILIYAAMYFFLITISEILPNHSEIPADKDAHNRSQSCHLILQTCNRFHYQIGLPQQWILESITDLRLHATGNNNKHNNNKYQQEQ